MDASSDDGTNLFHPEHHRRHLIRNYTVGDAPRSRLGGRTCCPSDYVVARQKIRPVAK